MQDRIDRQADFAAAEPAHPATRRSAESPTSGHDCEHHAHDHPHVPLERSEQALIGVRGIVLEIAGRTILEGIDLDIDAGEIVTIIGPNGAGKTTLVRTLLGLQKPDAGELWRKDGLVIGYAPQRFDIDRSVPMTVGRFVAMGQAAAVRDDIANALKEVGAGKLEERQLSELSGGELQRVILARALVRKPQLLILDEPVRGVDFSGEAELYTLIGSLRRDHGLGVLLVSHDLHVVMAQSDRVICLNRHICCSGVPDKVAQHPEYARLFGPQAAQAFGLYRHHHDHRHTLAGTPEPSRSSGAERSDPER